MRMRAALLGLSQSAGTLRVGQGAGARDSSDESRLAERDGEAVLVAVLEPVIDGVHTGCGGGAAS
jgi:hypothetical protein